jgi:hypothetical protein
MPSTAARTRRLISPAAGAPANFGTLTRQDTVPDRPEITISVVRSFVGTGESSGRLGSVIGPTLTDGAAGVTGAVDAGGPGAAADGGDVAGGSAPVGGLLAVDTQPDAPRPDSKATINNVLAPRQSGRPAPGPLGSVMVSAPVRAATGSQPLGYEA